MANATAPLPPIPELGIGSLLQTAGALVLVVLLLWGALWALRRFGPLASGRMRTKDGLALTERLMLGNRQAVVVVDVQGRRFLLGVTEQQVRLLAELGTDDDAAVVAEDTKFSPKAPSVPKSDEEVTERFEDLLAWSSDDADADSGNRS